MRLHWRIYFALLASLLVFGLLLGFLWRQVFDPPPDLAELSRAELEAVMPPPQASPEAHQKVANRLRASWGASVTIFAADGSILASSGPWPPLVRPQDRPERPSRRGRADGRFGDRRPGLSERSERAGRSEWVERGAWRSFWGVPKEFAFADGRSILLRQGPRLDARRPGPLLTVFFVGLAVAAATYPVARRLTQRLGRLQGGVERLGAGDLAARVAVEGDDEVGRLAASFNRSAEQLERLVGSHKSLLANASHELRSPLARLRMALELLPGASASDSARRDQLICEATRNLAELDELVGEILLSSRLEVRPETIAREAFDLNALVAEEAAKVEAQATGEVSEFVGDAKLLRRAVRNLLDNSRRYGRPPIAITLRPVADRVELAVSDSGPGIPPADRQRVFEPFYRPAGSSEADGGVGLGLSLVRQIARAHGGEVRIEGKPDGGSRFVLIVPAGGSSPDPETEPEARSQDA